MSVLVKICGLRHEEHIAAAIDAGANAIGFVFADSVRNVTSQAARDLTRDLPHHVRRVAVMRHPSREDWQDVMNTFVPDVLQTDAEDFAVLDVPASVERWPVYRQGNVVGIDAATFVYEGQNSGAGETVDWDNAATIAAQGEMILAGGLNAENVVGAIDTVRPFGVDVSSGVESSPGQKDSDRIREFIQAVRTVEKQR